MVTTKNFKFKGMDVRITYIDEAARTIEHLVNGHTVSSTEVKPISESTRKKLDTEMNTGFILNPSLSLLRVYELLTA